MGAVGPTSGHIGPTLELLLVDTAQDLVIKVRAPPTKTPVESRVCVISHFSRGDSATLWTIAGQAPLFMVSPVGILQWAAVPSSRGSS